MTDKESLLPAPSSNGRGKRRVDIALSPTANGARGPRHRPPPHVAISQSRRHRSDRPTVLSTGN